MSKRTNARKEQFLKERTEYGNIIKQSENYIRFNYKYFTFGDGFGQTFEEWQTEGILADLNNKLVGVSGKTKIELMQDGTLELFINGYPLDSMFTRPKVLSSLDLKWARIRVTGKRRLIGFFLPTNVYEDEKGEVRETDTNVFYVVFLDKDHQFAPSKKRNT